MMSTRRRSVREKKPPQNYFKEESSDDEGDDEKTKAAKQKLKQLMNDDSEVESDFEKEIDNQVKEMSESDESDDEDEEGDKGTFADGGVKSFRLSESESSEDDEDKGKRKNKQVSGNIFLRRKSHTFEDECQDEASQRLLALAGGLSQANEVWKETTKTPPVKDKKKGKGKATNKRKSLEIFETVKKPKKDSNVHSMDSIAKLLAQGEGVKPHDILSSDEEQLPEPVLAKDGVEITVPVPEHLRKRKKKGFDVEAYLKREMAREVRELSLVTHKSSLVCLLAHVLHLNSVTSDPGLQCLALSLVPQQNLFTKDTITLIRLGHLVTWLRDSVPVNKHSDQVSLKPVSVRLEQALASLLVMEDMELVLVFALVCRALGLNTRIVVHLNLPSKADCNKPAATVDTKMGKSDKNKTKTEASKARKRSKSTDSESEEDVRKLNSKSKRRSKSTSRDKKESEEKPTLASKLASAVSKRKSKTLAPTATEDTIIKGIKDIPSKESKRSRATHSKSSKSNMKVKDDEKPSTSQGSSSRSKGSGKSDKLNENIKSSEKATSKPQTVMDSGKSNTTYKQNYWVEVYLIKEKKWIPVDVLSGKINNPSDIESRLAKPVLYVLAVNMKGLVKDVTRRYSSNYLTQSRKLRVDENWLGETLSPWLDRDNKKEDTELVKKSEEGPLPTSVSAFKGHPLYALQRHLLKFEAIYPVEAPTLGFIKGEPVYARECVHTLLGRTAWLKEGKVVRIGEEPYKVVKARPKWDRMSGTKKADEPLELFGSWQTELYVAPVARDGKVPRNEYGNVELFKPWMMPKGCVQIPINGMQSVIRKSGIDAAPAMVGWDFSSGGSHPVFDGYVVCQENAEALMDAWNQEQEAKAQRERDKREKRVTDNWKRLVKGLMFREKMRLKYMDDKH